VRRRQGIFYRRLEDVNLPAKRRTIYSRKRGGKTKEKGREARDMAFISRRRVLRRDGSLRRCKAVAVCSAITGRERRDKWRRRCIGCAADSGPRSEPRAQPAPPLPPPLPRGQGLDRVRRMKTCVAPDEKTHGGRDWARFSVSAPPNAIWGAFRGGEWRCSNVSKRSSGT
jgi:hypothetical protein